MGVAGREIRKGLENSQTESANALVQKVEKCDDRRVAVLDEEDIRKKCQFDNFPRQTILLFAITFCECSFNRRFDIVSGALVLVVVELCTFALVWDSEADFFAFL